MIGTKITLDTAVGGICLLSILLSLFALVAAFAPAPAPVLFLLLLLSFLLLVLGGAAATGAFATCGRSPAAAVFLVTAAIAFATR